MTAAIGDKRITASYIYIHCCDTIYTHKASFSGLYKAAFLELAVILNKYHVYSIMHCICCQQPEMLCAFNKHILLGFSVRIRSHIFASLSDVLLLLVHYYYCTYLDQENPD